MIKKKTKRTNKTSSNIQPVMVTDERLIEEISELEEFDTSDLVDDIEPYDNSRETYNYNYAREDKDRIIPKLKLNSVKQQSDIIGYDRIKLCLSLSHANEVEFTVAREKFFRTSNPHIPATKDEDRLCLYAEEKTYTQMFLSDKEQRLLDSNTYDNQPYRKARLEFPNAKPFFDKDNLRLGLVHMYFYNGEFIIVITGKIVSGEGNLGLITLNNIDEALDVIKSTGLVDFNNEAFRRHALVLSADVTNDLLVSDINSSVKATLSFLPLRTDRYCILNYGNSGYEVLARGKKSKQTPNYIFCAYNKGAEIREHRQRSYIERIGKRGMFVANNTIRMELRLRNFPAIRKFLAPERENGTLPLNELLVCRQRPIIQMLRLLNITSESLREARGKYITMVEEDTYPTQAEFERMHGLIRLLELHEYDLTKVRSYIEVETKRKTHSTYFREKRDILQRYITCYMPQTVATLTELLQAMSY